MSDFFPKRSSFDRVISLVSNREELENIHADTEVPDVIKNWLLRLKRLYGVPFNYLVPDEKFLPTESIRFFQVDTNWIDYLVEGACSIARSSSSEQDHDAVMLPKIHEATALNIPPAADGTPQQFSGFLLRSQLIAGWPNLEILPHDKDDNQLTAVIRHENLSPSILLFITVGVIDYVLFREPPMGLHFGIDIDGEKRLRYVTVPASAPSGTQPGDQIPGTKSTPTFRTGRVLKMNDLATDIKTKLYQKKADNDPSGNPLPFTSAEFALELVEGSQEVKFTSGTDTK